MIKRQKSPTLPLFFCINVRTDVLPDVQPIIIKRVSHIVIRTCNTFFVEQHQQIPIAVGTIIPTRPRPIQIQATVLWQNLRRKSPQMLYYFRLFHIAKNIYGKIKQNIESKKEKISPSKNWNADGSSATQIIAHKSLF